ncbi:MAG TPA: hypothetical protein VG838_01960 [Opitutaceae bacterium]|nr:hypothetical protein [Opitutaceae bacterium]
MTTLPVSLRLHARHFALGLICPLFVALGSSSLSAQTDGAAASAPVFSEDFESGSLSPKVWDVREFGDVDIVVQQSQVAHGKSALKVHTANGARNAFASIVATHLPNSVRQHHFGRVYMFISPDMPAGHDALMSAGRPGWPLSDFLEIGASGGKSPMVSYQQNAPLPVFRGETIGPDKSSHPYPVGRWFCLEWEFNDNPDNIRLWIDGEQVRDAGMDNNPIINRQKNPPAPKGGAAKNGEAAPAAPTLPMEPKNSGLTGGFYDFAFGFRYWGAPKTDYDIYYDDIAIDTKRIGPLK